MSETPTPRACAAIETHDLTRTFGAVTAVDRLCLTVEAGEFFGFLGPNGAGKSTTIHMLTGLLQATSGSARLLGFDLERDAVEVKRRLGVVPDGLALFDRLTAREYLLFSGRMYGMERAVIRSRSEELLEWMDLQDERKKLIVDYSHGMKKKLALAAALLHEPRLLFLDEPFEGLDALAARSIKEVLTSLADHGVTVFLTSHILEIVERLCRSVAIIHQGRLVAQGSLDELRAGITPGSGGRGAEAMTLEEIFVNLVETGETAPRTLSWLE